MFGMTIIGRGGYVWCGHYYFLLIFICSANDSITCMHSFTGFLVGRKGVEWEVGEGRVVFT